MPPISFIVNPVRSHATLCDGAGIQDEVGFRLPYVY